MACGDGDGVAVGVAVGVGVGVGVGVAVGAGTGVDSGPSLGLGSAMLTAERFEMPPTAAPSSAARKSANAANRAGRADTC